MKKELVIELRGVEFVNKGAELMLHSMLIRLREKYPHIQFVMEASPRSHRENHKANGIYTKANFKKFRIDFSPVLSALPGSLLKKFNLKKEKDINVVMDASGFAFGNQWGAGKAGTRLANHIVKWKKQGKLIILMPQAFGPFTEELLINKMEQIVLNADLIFARDEMSFNYISQLSNRAGNIRLKPDFTNLLKGKVPPYFYTSDYEIAIIPNSKMIETASAQDGERYINLLKSTVRVLQENGSKPFFLIHEGKMDIHIATRINNEVDKKIKVIQEEDPLFVKGIIGKSRAVITSRFHGLVSSLAQGIPCLATGWSHKYAMLLKDYGYPEGLINIDITEDCLREKLCVLLNGPRNAMIKTQLKRAAEKQKQLSEEMWEMVFDKINTVIK